MMKSKLLCFLAGFFCFGMVSAQCVSSVYDDFESGSISPSWTLQGSYTRAVLTSGSPQGSNHLIQNGVSSHYGGMVWNFTPSTPNYISYYVNSGPGQTGATGYVVIGDAGTSGNNGVIFMYNTGSNTFRFYNGPVNYELPTVPNTWYHIEFKNINYTTKTYDLWSNNVLVYANYGFRNTASTNLAQIHLYNLQGTSNTFCEYDQIVIGTAPLSIGSMVSNPLCNGDTTGMISNTVVSGGVAPITYSWSTGDTSASISALSPGSYSFTATGGNGCTTTDTVTIVEPTALVGTGSTMDALCSYTADGGIAYALAGGTPGYSYMWSNGDTTDSLMNLMPGSYWVDYVDSNGCMGSDTLMVGSPAALAFNDSIMNVGCNGDSTGMIDLSTSGGTMPYSYLWNNGAMTEDLSSLLPGAYSVQVTDTNGCMHSDTFTISEPAALISNAVISPDYGLNQGAVDVTVIGGTAGYTFVWSNGATTEDISNLAAGTYSVTITDANGCMVSDTFTVDLLISIGLGNGQEIGIYPVPFANELKITLPAIESELQVQLYAMNGTMLFSEIVAAGQAQTKVFETNDLPAGVYFLRLNGEGIAKSYKLNKLD